jgi:hypothetical protein
MASSELQLISRVIRDGLPAYTHVVEYGIQENDFKGMEAKALWRYVDGYYKALETRGSIPGEDMAQVVSPEFALCDTPAMKTDALCYEVRKARLRIDVKHLAKELISLAEVDPASAAIQLHAALSEVIELTSSKRTDVDFVDSYPRILDDYEKTNQGIITAAAPWPWPSLQSATGGLAVDDFIVFYGRPKSKKTWVLSYLIAELYARGKKILLYTKEMTPLNLFKRIAACLARVPYQEFRTGSLDSRFVADLYDLQHLVGHAEGRGRLIALSGKDVAKGGDTVAWVQAKAEKYKPDVIVIDGMYLLSDGQGKKTQDWNRVMNISRDIRAMSLDLEVPVVATMQANRKAAGHSNAELDEIAYADAIGQDATIAIRVISEKTTPTIALVVGGSREFSLHGVRIGGEPATDFTEKELMTEKDILHAKEGDAKTEEEPETAATHAKPRKNMRAPVTKSDLEGKLLDHQLKGL